MLGRPILITEGFLIAEELIKHSNSVFTKEDRSSLPIHQ